VSGVTNNSDGLGAPERVGATAPPIADVHASMTLAARRLRIRASLQGGRALGLIDLERVA